MSNTAVCLNSPNTIAVCWCECVLTPLIAKAGSSWTKDDVKHLHEHLKRFHFSLELSDSSTGQPQPGKDDKDSKWGTFTTRAVAMFAKHPKVKTETERVINSDGKTITNDIADKIQEWCHSGLSSPENYWEFPQLRIDKTGQVIDAFGNDLKKGQQSAFHHHIKQIQEDLAKSGFGVHADSLCSIGKKPSPDGWYREFPDNAVDSNVKELHDLHYLICKFQRQAQWLWRMNSAGEHLKDAEAADASVYTGAVNGVVDHQTAQVLHIWADRGLHMVINKFELLDLHWPPESSTNITNSPTNAAARLRSDAAKKWLSAAKTIYEKQATIDGPYASSPRNWKSGKPASSGSASAFSWHYSGLAVDLAQRFAGGDATVSDKLRYVLEPDGNKFRIWCWLSPQPEPPADHADDKKDPYTQYRNRNIKAKVDISGSNLHRDPKKADESDSHPLGHTCSDFVIRTVRDGWYVDITRILEENGLMRIPRHSNWKSEPKSWEWWHYQYEPALPPGAAGEVTFGEYLQIIGVHEYQVRQHGWSSHADFQHAAG